MNHGSRNVDFATITDAALWQQVVERDDVAFRQIHDRYSQRLLAAIASRARPPLIADDILQIAWTKAWNKADGFTDKDGSLSKWLFKVALNTLRDEIRKLERRPEISFDETIDIGDRTEDSKQDDHTEFFRECLHLIGQKWAQIIRFRIYDGMSAKEIAAAIKVTPGTVDKYLTVGRNRIRECVEQKIQEAGQTS